MHANWIRDPNSVDQAWQDYFSGGSAGNLNTIIDQLSASGALSGSSGADLSHA